MRLNYKLVETTFYFGRDDDCCTKYYRIGYAHSHTISEADRIHKINKLIAN